MKIIKLSILSILLLSLVSCDNEPFESEFNSLTQNPIDNNTENQEEDNSENGDDNDNNGNDGDDNSDVTLIGEWHIISKKINENPPYSPECQFILIFTTTEITEYEYFNINCESLYVSTATYTYENAIILATESNGFNYSLTVNSLTETNLITQSYFSDTDTTVINTYEKVE